MDIRQAISKKRKTAVEKHEKPSKDEQTKARLLKLAPCKDETCLNGPPEIETYGLCVPCQTKCILIIKSEQNGAKTDRTILNHYKDWFSVHMKDEFINTHKDQKFYPVAQPNP
jgi:hypothetical protein